MFKKILIANRGEIAVRVIRTCRDLGIKTIAIYDESDQKSLHVILADECVRLDSVAGYLDSKQIVEIAKSQKADAIYPGYGFLSEMPDFARSCQEAGISFIGPSVETLKLCSSKLELMKLAESCGIETPPHSNISFNPGQSAEILKEANKLGFPVYLKAVKGRTVRSTEVAHSKDELQRCAEECSREGERLYNDPSVYLEKAIYPGRTVQVQFLSDKNQCIQFLGTVDVSLQRHNTRILCESPAPGLKNEKVLMELATGIIKSCKYQGLGAVEFLLDENEQAYFLDLQARIQVEHALIESISDLDLVEEQLLIANGKELLHTSSQYPSKGFAMQCRVYAEDLLRQSLPSPGLLSRFRMPGGPHVRVDAYGYGGCRIPVHFSPLLATITSRAKTRELCISRLKRALRETAITGVKTNLAAIQVILDDPDFTSAAHIKGAQTCVARLFTSTDTNVYLAGIVALAYLHRKQRRKPAESKRLSGGWHVSSRLSRERF